MYPKIIFVYAICKSFPLRNIRKKAKEQRVEPDGQLGSICASLGPSCSSSFPYRFRNLIEKYREIVYLVRNICKTSRFKTQNQNWEVKKVTMFNVKVSNELVISFCL